MTKLKWGPTTDLKHIASMPLEHRTPFGDKGSTRAVVIVNTAEPTLLNLPCASQVFYFPFEEKFLLNSHSTYIRSICFKHLEKILLKVSVTSLADRPVRQTNPLQSQKAANSV
jgi:hypothetical protein